MLKPIFLYLIITILLTSNHTSIAQNNHRKLLNSNVNLADVDELNPIISLDGKTLYFSRGLYNENIGGKQAGQDIYACRLSENNEWQKANNIGKPLNNLENNAIGGFSKLEQKVFVSNEYKNLSQGISVSTFTGNKFSKPQQVFTDKEIASNGYLSFYVSPDEKYMLLSMFTDPIHNEDLFVSFQLPGGWTKPKTLGKTINTNGLELSPFITNNGKTLFFASTGRGGFGDADIFCATRLDDTWTNWSTPINLGNEVNTSGFDAYFVTDTTFNVAYFCSGENLNSSSDIYTIKTSDIEILNKKTDTIRLTTLVNKKIYGTISNVLKKEKYMYLSGAKSTTNSIFEITEQADFIDYVPQQNYFGNDTVRIEVCKTKDKQTCDSVLLIVDVQRQSMAIKNIITDANTGNPMSAKVILNNDTLLKLKKIESKIPFEFICELKPFKKNKLIITQDGYFPMVFNYDLTDSVNTFLALNNVALKPIEVGSLVGLNNIFFETGKSIIKQQSYDELDNLANTLLKTPTLKINISGHTDNVGNELANQKLSDERVKSVIQYLISKGVAANKLKGKGFGSKLPKTTNDTEEGRLENRRVEFTVESK